MQCMLTLFFIKSQSPRSSINHLLFRFQFTKNCIKSNRICRRGIKLNFMETKLLVPDVLVPYHPQFFAICDESRAIAAEYKHGLEKYPDLSNTPTVTAKSSTSTAFGTTFLTVNGITSTNSSATSWSLPESPEKLNRSKNGASQTSNTTRYV